MGNGNAVWPSGLTRRATFLTRKVSLQTIFSTIPALVKAA